MSALQELMNHQSTRAGGREGADRRWGPKRWKLDEVRSEAAAYADENDDYKVWGFRVASSKI